MQLLKLDASSLIYAIKGNYISFLQKMFDKLIVVDSIYQEVVIEGKKRAKRDAYVIDKYLEDGILERHHDETNPPIFRLGKCEIAVIHATKVEKCTALIDDQKAKKVSFQNNVNTKWTSLLFLEALKFKKITEIEFDDLLAKYIKVASPSIIEYQIILEMKKLVM